MDALRKAGDSCGARLTVTRARHAGGPGRAAVRQARRRHRARHDGLERRQGRGDRRRLRLRHAKGQRAWRRADAAGLSQQPRRRRARRHLQRAGPGGEHRHQADQFDPRRRAIRSTAPAQPTVVETFGRHDPCVGIRATPIAEAMLALVVMDHALRHRALCGDVVAPLPPIPGDAGARDRRVKTDLNAGAAPFRAAPFGALWLCYFGFVGLFSPYSPLWLSHLGYSTLAIGAFASLQSWTRIVAPYGWGWLADHGGRRVVLLRAAALISTLAALGAVVRAVRPAWAAGAGDGALVPGQRRGHADRRDAAAEAPARRHRAGRAALRPRAAVGFDRLPRRGAGLRRAAAGASASARCRCSACC